MPSNIILPQWGMGMNEGQVVKWLKSVGDAVAKGDALVEIESTKVNAEVEATSDGALGRIAINEGETVPVGTVLGYILLEGETESDLPEVAAKSGADDAGAAPAGSGVRSRRRGAGGGKVVATPRARRLAKQLDVDIESIASGTGPSGRITEDDVRAAAESGAAGAYELGIEPAERVPLTGMRGVIAKRMTESAAAALVTLHTKADVSPAVAFQRELLRAWRRERVRPQYQDLVIAATVRALKEHRIANAHLVGDEVLQFDQINLGFALAVPNGLLVPVIRDAGSKSTLELARAVRDLARRSKSGELGPEDLTGSTFSLTNLGGYGITNFTPLINPPEVGILGVGAVEQEPRFNANGAVEPHSMGFFSLTFDHRAWDGAPASEFLQSIASHLASPEWMRDA